MMSTHELGRSWGHGGPKVPSWYGDFGCLVPFDLWSFSLGGPGHHTCWHGACRCLVPCGLVSLGLGGALLLFAFVHSLLAACPWSGAAALQIFVICFMLKLFAKRSMVGIGIVGICWIIAMFLGHVPCPAPFGPLLKLVRLCQAVGTQIFPTSACLLV